MTQWECKAACEISRTLEEMMGLRFALKICVHAIYSSGALSRLYRSPTVKILWYVGSLGSDCNYWIFFHMGFTLMDPLVKVWVISDWFILKAINCYSIGVLCNPHENKLLTKLGSLSLSLSLSRSLSPIEDRENLWFVQESMKTISCFFHPPITRKLNFWSLNWLHSRMVQIFFEFLICFFFGKQETKFYC